MAPPFSDRHRYAQNYIFYALTSGVSVYTPAVLLWIRRRELSEFEQGVIVGGRRMGHSTLETVRAFDTSRFMGAKYVLKVLDRCHYGPS